jgi:scaffold protein (connect acetoacetyl-CoA thiolase and HMG-CoA synthase)
MAIQAWRIRDRYYRLIGSKCKDCGDEFFPPVYRCKGCGSEHIVDREMPRTGKIMTYTFLHEPLPGYEAQTPLCLALVKLDNGARILTQIVDSPEDAVITGAKVRAAKVDGESGQITYGYKFIVDR